MSKDEVVKLYEVGQVESRNNEIYIGDLESDYLSPIIIDTERSIIMEKPKKSNSIMCDLFGDGIYSFYASVDSNKKIKSLHIQFSPEGIPNEKGISKVKYKKKKIFREFFKINEI